MWLNLFHNKIDDLWQELDMFFLIHDLQSLDVFYCYADLVKLSVSSINLSNKMKSQVSCFNYSTPALIKFQFQQRRNVEI